MGCGFKSLQAIPRGWIAFWDLVENQWRFGGREYHGQMCVRKSFLVVMCGIDERESRDKMFSSEAILVVQAKGNLCY